MLHGDHGAKGCPVPCRPCSGPWATSSPAWSAWKAATAHRLPANTHCARAGTFLGGLRAVRADHCRDGAHCWAGGGCCNAGWGVGCRHWVPSLCARQVLCACKQHRRSTSRDFPAACCCYVGLGHGKEPVQSCAKGLQAAKQPLSIPGPAPAVLKLRAVLSQRREVSAALSWSLGSQPCVPQGSGWGAASRQGPGRSEGAAQLCLCSSCCAEWRVKGRHRNSCPR